MEALDFESKRSELNIQSIEFLPNKQHSDSLDLRISFGNMGRKARIKYSKSVAFISNKEGEYIRFLTREVSEDNSTNYEIEPYSKDKIFAFHFAKKELEEENRTFWFVLTFIYEDLITKKVYKEPIYLYLNLPWVRDLEFILQTPSQVVKTDSVLKEKNKFEIIYPTEYYK